jgi:hypothetical protein
VSRNRAVVVVLKLLVILAVEAALIWAGWAAGWLR